MSHVSTHAIPPLLVLSGSVVERLLVLLPDVDAVEEVETRGREDSLAKNWRQMNAGERDAALALGWTEESWEAGRMDGYLNLWATNAISEQYGHKTMTALQQDAAGVLGSKVTRHLQLLVIDGQIVDRLLVVMT
jgi:hypothetical protein